MCMVIVDVFNLLLATLDNLSLASFHMSGIAIVLPCDWFNIVVFHSSSSPPQSNSLHLPGAGEGYASSTSAKRFRPKQIPNKSHVGIGNQ